MKENPNDYFNFGFNLNDFKTYLQKLVYCRAAKKYI